MNIKKGIAGPKPKYELSFKRKLCEELLSGTISYREIARKYNLKSPGLLSGWIRWYRQEQTELINLQSMSTEPSQSETNSSPNSSEEYRKLQEELKLAKLKVTALETMIDVAENQFNIEIRKKPGTKPLEE